jgi:RNA polymerase sigma-70 factor (ECF subfamily)
MRGEPGAFGQLYQLHVDAVYRYLRFRVPDDELAEDLTHDVFVSALRHIGELRAAERCRAWLFQIAHNRLSNHWRDASLRPLPAARLPDPSLLPEDAPAGGAVEEDGYEAVAHRIEAAGAVAAMDRLTELQREVLTLRFVAGLSLVETAEAMDRTVNAVKNLQHHALARLRQHLDVPAGAP